jgi:hypothetical protein
MQLKGEDGLGGRRREEVAGAGASPEQQGRSTSEVQAGRGRYRELAGRVLNEWGEEKKGRKKKGRGVGVVRASWSPTMQILTCGIMPCQNFEFFH